MGLNRFAVSVQVPTGQMINEIDQIIVEACRKDVGDDFVYPDCPECDGEGSSIKPGSDGSVKTTCQRCAGHKTITIDPQDHLPDWFVGQWVEKQKEGR